MDVQSPVSVLSALTNGTARTTRRTLQFAGRTLDVTGAKRYLHASLQEAYNGLTGNHSMSVKWETGDYLVRKASQLKRQERPFQLLRETTGYPLLDKFGYGSPAME